MKIFCKNILFATFVLNCAVGKIFSEKNVEPFVQSLIEHTLVKKFAQEGPVVFLLSNDVHEDRVASVNAVELPKTTQWLQDISFKIVSENYLWPISVHHPENEEYSTVLLPKGYIIFVNPQTEELNNNFTDYVGKLKDTSFWNPRSNFLVFTSGKLEVPPHEFANTVLTILKGLHNIINAVMIIFTGDTYGKNSIYYKNETNITSVEDITKIYAYTLFPYSNGACNEDVTLLVGKWTVHNASEESFSAVDLFPNKLPKTFKGCVLNIGAIGPEPYVIKEDYTTDEGENKFVLEGVGVELINLFVKQMNFTSKYYEPHPNFEIDSVAELGMMLIFRDIDVVSGTVPHLLELHLYGDASVPMISDTVQYLVPCPKPMRKTERIISLFSLSTWSCMGFVFIFVSFLFWSLSNYPTRTIGFTGFNLLAQCFSAAWAVLLGISVPQMPLSLGTRQLFIIYVWYCFVFNTIFQAYFTSFLVEPGYEARLKALDDVRRAGLKAGIYDIMEIMRELVNFNELIDFEKKIYSDFDECVSSVMFKGEMFSPSISYFPSYIASKSGVSDHSKFICFLDESVVTLQFGAVVPIGHPFLQILNVHIRRCLEGGLLETYWSKIKHEVHLKANVINENSEFVVFSLTHLSPVFVLLLFGYILGVSVFACEFTVFMIKNNKRRFIDLKFHNFNNG
ncbi:hypothetical protein L9F63_008696 [Diploptera punctata]|uniref:Uncharacterized protein n=1 Tax=Diploptera punctata TaxID=6984 RepID=A0AAD7Z5M6_DIPPU|nr:hypothetical protein L9F63_008696 [Diploptera punctata]